MELLFSTIPIFLIVLAGYLLKRIGVLDESIVLGCEKFNHYALLPALVFQKMVTGFGAQAYWWQISSVVLYILILTAVILMLWQRATAKYSGKDFTSIFQGSIRFNMYLSLAVAAQLFGSKGFDAAIFIAGVMSLLTGFFSILVFQVWGTKPRSVYKAFFVEFLFNPLNLGFLAGIALNLLDVYMPVFALDSLRIVGNAAIPLGLLVLGATLNPKDVQYNMQVIFITSLVQFFFKPILVYFILVYFTKLPPLLTGVTLMLFVAPTSTLSYLLAEELEGNKSMLRSVITMQSIIAFVAIPLIALIMLR